MKRNWMDLGGAAEYLGVSKDFIRDMIKDGLPAFKIRQKVFIKNDDIEKYILSHKIV